MSRLFKYCALMVVLCLCLQSKAQQAKDSLRFQPQLDSVKASINVNEYEKAKRLGEILLQEATEAKSNPYKIQAHRSLSFITGRMRIYDQRRVHTENCLELSFEHGDYESAVVCANTMGLIYFNASKYDSAKLYYQLEMETARDFFPTRYPLALTNMAFIHGVLDQRDEELKYYMLAVEVAENHPEYDRAIGVRARAYSGLGDYYRFIGEFDKAVSNYESKLQLGTENDLKVVIYEAQYGLGRTYAHSDFYDFEKSESNFLKVTSDTTYEFEPYSYRARLGLAELYKTEKRYGESIALLKEVLIFYQESGSSDLQSMVQTLMGQVYFEMGDLPTSRDWIIRGVESSRKYGVIARERDALKVLYQLDSIQGRYKAAFTNYHRFTAINDSLSSQETKDRINELQIQYETEQTERQNTVLKADLEVQELRAQRQTGILIFAAALLLFLVISTLVYYRSYQRKKEDHKIISSQANELRQLSDFKEGLTSMVVHDMKNPINSIIGFSRGTPDEKKMKKINQSGYNILNLVTNMLDIQRFEETKVEVMAEPVEGYRLAAEAANEVHLLLQAKSLRFDNQVPNGLMFNIERALFDRVMINLLTNAIKYSKLGSIITVALGKVQDGYQEMIVRDEGEGIAENKLPYVFNKFWHKDARKSGLAPSTGLGLSFCKLAVEAHGGTIRVESGLSQGTSMIFTMPVSSATASGDSAVELLNNGQSGEKLNPAEMDILEPFLSTLRELEIHEVSAINKLIDQLEEKGLNKRWIGTLQASVYQGDQQKYNELIGQGA